MTAVAAFVCGIVFALGLGVSGMLQPAKVIGFLDVAGKWDPSLALVMGPAVGITMLAWRLRRGRTTPFGCEVPAQGIPDLDARLFVGATIFGIGWGMTGVCPGPSIVNLAAASTFTLVALASIVAGVALSFLPPLLRRKS